MKAGEIVFYTSNNKIRAGRLGHKFDFKKWVIVPLVGVKQRVIRKEEYIMSAEKIQKMLDICKKI